MNQDQAQQALIDILSGRPGILRDMIDRDARRFERAREAFRETFTPAQVAKIEKAEKLGWTVTQKHIKTGEVFLANDKNNATMVIEQDGSVSR